MVHHALVIMWLKLYGGRYLPIYRVKLSFVLKQFLYGWLTLRLTSVKPSLMRSKTNPRQKKPAVFSQNILGIISNEQDYILHVQVSIAMRFFHDMR
jgi:hypothetical protein